MKLLEEIAKDGTPLWKEIAVDTLKKVVSTVVVETLKAGIDLVKRERIRHDDYNFQQWKKAREEERKQAEADTEAEEAKKKGKKPAAKAGKKPAKKESPAVEEDDQQDDVDESKAAETDEEEDEAPSEPEKKWLEL